MASGEIDVTPGRVLSNTEVLDTGKLNDLGRPILRVKEAAITSRELAPGSIDSDKLNVDLEAQLGVSDGSVTTNKIVDGAVTAAKLATDAKVPTGVIMDFAGTTAPDGWLMCHGTAVSRSTYALLFSAIGTTYGAGDGSTTFNIPDLRGRVTAGYPSAGRIVDPAVVPGLSDVLGDTGGQYYHFITVAQMPSHAHAHAHNITFPHAAALGLGGHGITSYPTGRSMTGAPMCYTGTNVGGYIHIDATAAGGGQPINNVQPTMLLNKIIKAT